MIRLQTDIWVLVVGMAVLFLPGMPLAILLGLRRVVPIYLLPAGTFVLGLVPVSAALALSLWLRWPITAVMAMVGAITCAGLVACVAVDRRRFRTDAPQSWAKTLPGRVLRSVAAELKSISWGVAVVSLVAGLFAYLRGGLLLSDALYHAAQALKLQTFGRPSFDNTLTYIDTTAHPVYYLPGFHEMVAMIAKLSGTDVMIVMTVMPAVMVTMAVATFAGLGYVLFRSSAAAYFCAFAFVLVHIVSNVPQQAAVQYAMYPREIVTDTVMPLIIATWVVALWHRDRAVRWRALIVVLAGGAVLMVLHNSYVYLLALMVGGYLLGWALQAPWQREIVVRHLRASLLLGAVLGIGLALVWPALTSVETFIQESGVESSMLREPYRWEPRGSQFGMLFIGNPEGYHLLPDWLVSQGPLAFIGLCCVVLALRFRSHPATWYLTGTVLLVLAITLSDTLFPLLVQAASVSQSKRILHALPHAVALGFGMLVLAGVLEHLWKRKGRARVAAGLLAVTVTAIVATVTQKAPFSLRWLQHPEQAPGGPPTFAALPIRLLLLALVVMFAIDAARTMRRFVRMRRDGERPQGLIDVETPIFTVPGRVGLIVVTGIMLFGSTYQLELTGGFARDALKNYGPRNYRTVVQTRFDGVADHLWRLPRTDTVVMAEPMASHQLMAVAPVYVATSNPTHLAPTPANRREERYDMVLEFFSPQLSDAERFAILDEMRVTDIMLYRRESIRGRQLLPNRRALYLEEPENFSDDSPVGDFIARHPDAFRDIARNDYVRLYRVLSRSGRTS